MSDDSANVVVEHLPALRNELQAFRNQHECDMADLRERLSHVERGIAGVKRDHSDQYEGAARQQVSIDKPLERVERIERRLETGLTLADLLPDSSHQVLSNE